MGYSSAGIAAFYPLLPRMCLGYCQHHSPCAIIMLPTGSWRDTFLSGSRRRSGLHHQNREGEGAMHSSLLDARLDFGREARKGIPEVVLAETKSDEQIVALVRIQIERVGRAIVSRMRESTAARLVSEFGGQQVDLRRVARAAAIYAPGYACPRTGGRVGVLTAGTGDVPVAEE